jgi:hypothetical protein
MILTVQRLQSFFRKRWRSRAHPIMTGSTPGDQSLRCCSQTKPSGQLISYRRLEQMSPYPPFLPSVISEPSNGADVCMATPSPFSNPTPIATF